MRKQLESYLERAPEIVFEWNDPESEARGWVVINSLKGGAAGGGTRMRKGLTRNEVEALAKTMEIKFRVCGPSIGGAKSGIDFDPSDPRKRAVLQRWFKAIKPLLENYYGTAGDLNIDEKTEVRPFLQALGINHPQFGVLEGHYQYSDETKQSVLDRLKSGCEIPVRSENYSPKPATDSYGTIDLITGFGVFESIKQYYKIFKGESLEGKKVFIQGWGNVGAAAGWYLAKEGAKLVLIQDKDGYVQSSEGFSFEAVTDFMNTKVNNSVQDGLKVNKALEIHQLQEFQVDIFIPAAASKLVKPEFIEVLIKNGLDLISCGANVPFYEDALIFGSLTQKIDQEVSLIPDFIANCGVARLFAYLMGNEGPVTEEAIFNDITNTIKNAISELSKSSINPKNLTERALSIYTGN
ncbi:MAG: amino acid dehydrogenase [Saprospiraceae bacterium]|nr:amino acid dehydrogenase [Saprospiraceae bacterium]